MLENCQLYIIHSFISKFPFQILMNVLAALAIMEAVITTRTVTHAAAISDGVEPDVVRAASDKTSLI